MSIETLPDLINKTDSAEYIRDRIAVILAAETVNQVVLAAAEPEPLDWAYRVYIERKNPIELFMDQPEGDFSNVIPVVSVSYDGGTFDRASGDTIRSQALSAIFNIDVHGVGVSADVPGGGHITGDEAAVRNTERITRLVRNILMSALNHNLQFVPGIVWNRWVERIVTFKPENKETAFQVAAERIELGVKFSEWAPQHEGNPLEYVSVDIHRELDGKLTGEADYDYTAP